MSEGNDSVYRLLTSFLLGVVLTGIGSYFASQKDLITRREFSDYQARVDKRMDTHDAQISTLILLQQQNAVEIGKLIEDWKMNYPHKEK